VAEEEEKEAVIQDWVKRSGAIVATSALGVGLDIPDIRLVIHAGCPRSLRDFVQESGRGGRDGQTCKSIVISRLAGSKGSKGPSSKGCNNPGSKGSRSPGFNLAIPEEEDILDYIQDSVLCRRTILSRVIDGRMDRTSCEGDEALCDLCIEKKRQSLIAANSNWKAIGPEVGI